MGRKNATIEVPFQDFPVRKKAWSATFTPNITER